MRKESNQPGKAIDAGEANGGPKAVLAALKGKRLTATMRRRALKPKPAAK